MKVLLGVGGSDDSLRALSRALERAREAGDDLTIAVLDNPESPRAIDEVEQAVRDRLADSGIDATVRRLEGDPGSQLVDVAEREGFERIVLGGGETSPLGKIRLGSIAEFVVLNASVTVTLVR
ncbi:universal stress protein [Haloglomus litoreum]|uniref:universal stress protein n=1 Tax=Haloglomus litoreum TaxID=3034026 RepID=UPI0023E8414D|nr:universal stress protein [Haloglomus sp. DT116]